MSRLLVECGEALYGAQWRAPLARDLDVSERTIRRWSASDIPAGVYLDLLRLCVERASTLDKLSARLKSA